MTSPRISESPGIDLGPVVGPAEERIVQRRAPSSLRRSTLPTWLAGFCESSGCAVPARPRSERRTLMKIFPSGANAIRDADGVAHQAFRNKDVPVRL